MVEKLLNLDMMRSVKQQKILVMLTEIFAIAILTLINGLLSMSELAIVSSRPARLTTMQDKGNFGAGVALGLMTEPGKFLSAVQIGITLVGVLTGAISGATLGTRASGWLTNMGISPGIAQPLGVGGIVAIITYFSLVAGELVPKQVAMSNPEGIASKAAPVLRFVALICSPIVWLLDASSKILLWILGIKEISDKSITDEEIRLTLTEATEAGVMLESETEMIRGVMRVGDRNAKAMMTSKKDIIILDIDDDNEEMLKKIKESGYSRILVSDNDQIIGVLSINDIIGKEVFDIVPFVKEPQIVLDTADALSVIEVLKGSTERMVLVYNEYGDFQGVITAMDLLETITGDFAPTNGEDPDIIQREDGSWLVAGMENYDEFTSKTGFPDVEGDFNTVAGLVLTLFKRIPKTGDKTIVGGWCVEVVDMDDMRVDRIIFSQVSVNDG